MSYGSGCMTERYGLLTFAVWSRVSGVTAMERGTGTEDEANSEDMSVRVSRVYGVGPGNYESL